MPALALNNRKGDLGRVLVFVLSGGTDYILAATLAADRAMIVMLKTEAFTGGRLFGFCYGVVQLTAPVLNCFCRLESVFRYDGERACSLAV